MTPGGLYASTVAIVGATTLVGCSSRDPYGRNILVPEGSIYVEPTQEVGKLGYTIAHVDTIIGYIEAYRFHGGLDSEADRLLVDVFTTAATGRRIVSVAAQTLQRARTTGFRRVTGQPTTPSRRVREDLATLLTALGCEEVETEQRMTTDGTELEAWCAGDRRTQGSQ